MLELRAVNPMAVGAELPRSISGGNHPGTVAERASSASLACTRSLYSRFVLEARYLFRSRGIGHGGGYLAVSGLIEHLPRARERRGHGLLKTFHAVPMDYTGAITGIVPLESSSLVLRHCIRILCFWIDRA